MILGSFYNGQSNATMERGFYTFSVLLNTFNTLSILEQNNHTSDTLSIYKILINGLLDDACQWVSPIHSSTSLLRLKSARIRCSHYSD